jgi:flagellar FliL protein
MAGKEDLDLGVDQKSAKTKWIVIALASILVLLVGAAAGLYFTGTIQFGKAQAQAQQAAPAPSKQAYFYELEPFIVNFPPNETARLLQVGFSLLSFDEKTAQALKQHTPMLRNNLLLLLARSRPEELQSAAGKEALRQKALQEIEKLLAEQAQGGSLEAVFFTQFVMQ